MSRPLRLEFPGALYHITCRGDRHEAIYRSDADRAAHLQVLADGLDRFDARELIGIDHGLIDILARHQPRSGNVLRRGGIGQGAVGAARTDNDNFFNLACRWRGVGGSFLS